MVRLLLVFVLAALSDWVWAQYIAHVSAKNVFRGALFSSIIVLFSGIFTISYIEDYRTIVAGAAGAFLGTALSLRFSKKD